MQPVIDFAVVSSNVSCHRDRNLQQTGLEDQNMLWDSSEEHLVEGFIQNLFCLCCNPATQTPQIHPSCANYFQVTDLVSGGKCFCCTKSNESKLRSEILRNSEQDSHSEKMAVAASLL